MTREEKKRAIDCANEILSDLIGEFQKANCNGSEPMFGDVRLVKKCDYDDCADTDCIFSLQTYLIHDFSLIEKTDLVFNIRGTKKIAKYVYAVIDYEIWQMNQDAMKRMG
jgi:hypothetical protein